MKPTEIQIGDLLTFEDCLNDEAYPVIKVTGILQDSFFARIDDAKGEDELDYKGAVGIPLTDEILIKNGLKKAHCSRWNPVFTIFAVALNEIDDSDYTNREACPLCHTMIRYVHELQHAFRLCGIEKEIVV